MYIPTSTCRLRFDSWRSGPGAVGTVDVIRVKFRDKARKAGGREKQRVACAPERKNTAVRFSRDS